MEALGVIGAVWEGAIIAGFQCHAIQNKNQNHSIDKVQILRKKRR